MLRLTPRITQMLPNLRTWAPCCIICLIKSPAIRADLSSCAISDRSRSAAALLTLFAVALGQLLEAGIRA
jgi:hypothetical protein